MRIFFSTSHTVTRFSVTRCEQRTEISKRLLPSEHVQILALSTLLDPRFKNIHFQDRIACSKAIKLVKELLTTTTEAEVIEEVMSGSPDPTEEFNLWSEHYKLVNVKNSTPSPC